MSEKLTEIKELKEFETEAHKLIDNQFKDYIEGSSKIIEWSSETLERIKKVKEIFEKSDRSNQELSLSIMMLEESQATQLYLAKLQHQIILELKGASFYILYLPFYAYLGLSEQTMPIMMNKFKELEKGLDTLRKDGVEVGLNVEEDMKNEIKQIIEMMEESKKATKKYVI